MARTGDILVVGPSWVGDMVMAQTLFRCLKERQPGAAIDVLAPAWSNPLLERMPDVRAAIHLPFGHGELRLGERMAFGKALAKRGYRQAIVLPNSLKSALVPFFAGIPVRTGWRGEMRFYLLNDIRLLDKSRYPRMIDRFAALAWPPHAPLPETLPRPALSIADGGGERAMADLGLAPGRPVLALCPGAEFGPSKRWPAQNYGAVARSMIDRGWQVWIFGSGNDRPIADEIRQALSAEAAQHCAVLAGETTLAQAIDLLSVAGAVVTNDSGLMHVSAALGKPLAVIYGSTSPAFTPPLTERVAILSVAVDCGPCFQRECPKGHLKCQWGVTPDRVVAALDDLLDNNAGAASP